MLPLTIPGFNGNLEIQHLVLDFNGTLAVDGKLINGIKETLNDLALKITIHVLTGDTFGTAEKELKNIPCKLVTLPKEQQGKEKEQYLRKLNPLTVISVGNGRNDALMLRVSAIGIIVIQKEGASTEALMAADIICSDIFSALDLINNPMRLTATLRG